MPTYGYVCEQCGQELEAFQKMSDAPLRTCPACGKEALRRQIFATGIVFKGSGFYKTDYASKSGSKERSNGSSEGGGGSQGKGDAAAKSEGRSESKSESKSEGKSESKAGDKAPSASD